MKQTKRVDTPENSPIEPTAQNRLPVVSGVPIRTDLRAGLAWDDLDNEAKQLWSNLSNTLRGFTGGTDLPS